MLDDDDVVSLLDELLVLVAAELEDEEDEEGVEDEEPGAVGAGASSLPPPPPQAARVMARIRADAASLVVCFMFCLLGGGSRWKAAILVAWPGRHRAVRNVSCAGSGVRVRIFPTGFSARNCGSRNHVRPDQKKSRRCLPDATSGRGLAREAGAGRA